MNKIEKQIMEMAREIVESGCTVRELFDQLEMAINESNIKASAMLMACAIIEANEE